MIHAWVEVPAVVIPTDVEGQTLVIVVTVAVVMTAGVAGAAAPTVSTVAVRS